MANTNILNNIPFSDKVLKNSITNLQKETPEVTYYTTATVSADPGAVAVDVLSYTIEGQPLDRPFELKIEALLELTNNLGVAADQEFQIDLVDADDNVIITFGTVDIDSTETGIVTVKAEALYRSKLNDNSRGGWEISLKTDLDGTSSIVSGSPSYTIDTTVLDVADLRVIVTPETGTASTDIQLVSGKVTLDRQVWN